jgi:hypothetical protein
MNQNQNVTVDLSKDAIDLTCHECQNKTFKAVYVIKKISALLSPTGKVMHHPIAVFACSKCNTVHDDFLSAFNTSI